MRNSEEYVKYLMWSVHLAHHDIDEFEVASKLSKI